jgi:hypothetical protein
MDLKSDGHRSSGSVKNPDDLLIDEYYNRTCIEDIQYM